MIWHIVRYDMSGIDEPDRRRFEEQLEGLVELDTVAWIRVARDLEDPVVTGLIMGFDDVDALAAYRVDPKHVPVLTRLRELGITASRIDIATDDDPSQLP